MLNLYLDTIQAKLFDAHQQLLAAGEMITAEAIKNKFTGKNEQPRWLIKIFQEHNRQMEALVKRKECAKGTLTNFRTNLNHLINYLSWQYHLTDIDIRKINHSFVTGFDFYLRSRAGLGNNTTIKNIRNFGKIIRI